MATRSGPILSKSPMTLSSPSSCQQSMGPIMINSHKPEHGSCVSGRTVLYDRVIHVFKGVLMVISARKDPECG